jgi:hypothetical protein
MEFAQIIILFSFKNIQHCADNYESHRSSQKSEKKIQHQQTEEATPLLGIKSLSAIAAKTAKE